MVLVKNILKEISNQKSPLLDLDGFRDSLGCSFSVDDIQGLVQALNENGNVKFLSMYNNLLGDEHARVLSELKYVTNLDVSGNFLSTMGLNYLLTSNAIAEINIRDNLVYPPIHEITDTKKVTGLEKQADFNPPTHLEKELRDDSASEESETRLSIVVSDFLKQDHRKKFYDTGLRELRIEIPSSFSNKKRRAMFAGLESVLETDVFLELLDLSANKISDDEVKILTGALSRNDTLLSLDLSDNEISSESTRNFLWLLDNNNALLSLKLDENNISEDDLNVMMERLRLRRTKVTNMAIAQPEHVVEETNYPGTEHPKTRDFLVLYPSFSGKIPTVSEALVNKCSVPKI